MAPLYVVHRPDPGEPSPDSTFAEAMEKVRGRAKKLVRPYDVFPRGEREDAQRFRRRAKAVGTYGHRLKHIKVGSVLVLAGSNTKIETRRIEPPSIELPDSLRPSYVPRVQQQIYTFIMVNFRGVRWAGTCYCRDNRQGTGLSDHGCCGAGDFFPTSKAQGDEIFRAVMREFGNQIEYIAWQVSLHYDHLHIATCRCRHCFPGGCI